MQKKHKKILELLKQEYPKAKCALSYTTPWQLMVAVMLSAQCTDERVNKVTPVLFSKYPTVEDIYHMNIEDLKVIIHSTGFYNNKAKNMKRAATMIVEKFDGDIPDNMKDLVSIPGIARKSANVILSEWFKKDVGVVVDTHVKRISNLIGFTKEKNPVKIEKDLMKLFEQSDWERLSTVLVHHGRKICIARRPNCEICPINKLCNSAFKNM